MQTVITCYFNPNNCRFRLPNYRQFHEGLKRLKMPLHTIELVFGNEQFQLTDSDATVLKQLRAKDMMFQKERMLNILLSELAPEYTEVIWMDCDLFYMDNEWPERISKALQDYQVVQPYTLSVALPYSEFSNEDPHNFIYYNCLGSGRIKNSYAYYQTKRKSYANFHHGHVGYAWAARREFLDKFKFYDPIISGAGDLFMLMGLTGNFGWLDYPHELKWYGKEATEHFLDWGFPVYQEVRGKIGYTSDTLFHLWHGDINERNYLMHTRHLQGNKFNPTEDLAIDENGCWKWNSNKPKLHTAMRGVFGLQQVRERPYIHS